MIEKALTFGGWPGLILLLIGTVIGLTLWITCILLNRFRAALYVTIAMFPFSFYAARASGLIAYQITDFDQRVGLTTLLIAGLFGALFMSGRLRRPRRSLSRWTEWFLWLFAVSLTIGQLVTHTVRSALLLSIGAAWQYVALFYILISLIRRERHCVPLLNSIFVCSLLNVLVRVVAKGERLIIPLSSVTAGDALTFGAEAGRVGSGALGPGVSYAGYLAIFITLALAVYFINRQWIYVVYIAFMFLELLNTFTRGGLLVLGFLVLLIAFKASRRLVFRTIVMGTAAIVVAWPFIYRYATLRGFSFNVMGVENFALRIQLIRMFADEYRFNWWGNGILNQTMFELAPWISVPVHNAYLEILDTCGIFPFLAFTAMSILMVVAAVRLSFMPPSSKAGRVSSRLAPFLLVAIVQWIVFANTTSTSILAYYPYEGTAVFWIVGCLPLVLLEARRRVARASSTLLVHPAAATLREEVHAPS